MITRRELLAGTAVAAAGLTRRVAAAAGAAQRGDTPVSFTVPPGACDCHIHLFGDHARYPFIPDRAYTPTAITLDQVRAVHRELHVDRVVFVQPSVYGTDNACMLDAVRQTGATARGVAVVDDKTPETTLDAMARAGVRGIRVNLENAGITDPVVARTRLQAAIARVRRLNWHVEIYARLSVIAAVNDVIMASPVPIVIDHFGRVVAAEGVTQAGFDGILAAVRAGRAYVKISAPYLESSLAPDFTDMVPFARSLVAMNPQRLLWGTDWPHPDSTPAPGRKNTDIAPFLPIDNGRVFNQFAVWVPDATVRKTILVDNPARLYGF
jgi:predicted TIM-barrel fold metal-dependent hydrolase